MGIWNELGTVLAAGGGGGILGLFGSIVNRGMSYFERKEDRKHELALAALEEAKDNRRHAHEVALHQLNIETLGKETEKEVLIAREAGRWQGLEASHASTERANENFKGSVWVEDMKGATRPFITLLLWVLVLVVFFFVPSEAKVTIISVVIFCAATATTWWFGDRAPDYKQLSVGS